MDKTQQSTLSLSHTHTNTHKQTHRLLHERVLAAEALAAQPGVRLVHEQHRLREREVRARALERRQLCCFCLCVNGASPEAGHCGGKETCVVSGTMGVCCRTSKQFSLAPPIFLPSPLDTLTWPSSSLGVAPKKGCR